MATPNPSSIKAFSGPPFSSLLAASSSPPSFNKQSAIPPKLRRLITTNASATEVDSSSFSPPIMVAATLNSIPRVRAKKVRPEFKMFGDFNLADEHAVRDDSRPNHCFLADYAKSGFTVSGDNQFEEETSAEIRGRLEKDLIPAPFKAWAYYNHKRMLEGKEMSVPDILLNGHDSCHDCVMMDENILYFKPSPNNKLVACAEVSEGDRMCTVYIINAESLESVGKPLVGMISYIEWAGNESLLYSTTDDTLRSDKVWLHKVGKDQSSDSCLYRERDAKCSLGLHASKSKKYLFLTSESKAAKSIYYLDVEKLEEGFKVLTSQLDGIDTSLSQSGSNFFVKQDEPSSSELLTCPIGQTIPTSSPTNNLRSRSFLAVMRMSIDEIASVREGMLLTWVISYFKFLLSLTLWKNMFKLINMLLLILLMPFTGNQRHCAVLAVDGVRSEEKQKGLVIMKKDKQLRGNPLPRPVDVEVLVRRQLAIQRVQEDKDETDKTARAFSLFVAPRGVTLFTQSWTPVSGDIKGVILLLHGLNEHSGRYNRFAKQLNGKGYKVYGLDWIGHGGSDGLHGYVNSLDDVISDVKSFLEEISTQNPGAPFFCFGHSTGGSILLEAALDPKFECKIAGLILTSPAIGVEASHPIYTILAPVMSTLLPKYQCGAANKKGAIVSRDPAALVEKYSDPLVFTGSLRVRTGYEILRVSNYLQRNVRRLKVPFLVLHGTADVITSPKASEELYMEAASADKRIKLYDGLLHDLLFEPEREVIVHDIMEWLVERT